MKPGDEADDKATISRGAAEFAASMFGLLGDAVNYVEVEFTDPNIVMRIQRTDGKTPHQLRVDAERERDEWKAGSNHWERCFEDGCRARDVLVKLYETEKRRAVRYYDVLNVLRGEVIIAIIEQTKRGLSGMPSPLAMVPMSTLKWLERCLNDAVSQPTEEP